MTTLNAWKYKALQVIEGTDSYKQLNALERAAYIQYLGLTTPVSKHVVGLRMDFYNTINGVIYTGFIQDVMKAAMTTALAGIYTTSTNISDLEYHFWKGVAEGDIDISGCPWVATFNGVDQYIDFPGRSSDIPSGVTLDLVAHIKTTGSDEGIVATHGASVDNYVYLSVTSGGFIKLNTNGYTPGNGTISINDGQWHKVAVRIHTGTGIYTVYVDDIEDYTGTHSNPASLVATLSLTIGAYRTSTPGALSGYFTGSIADVGIVVNSEPTLFVSIDDGWAANPYIDNDYTTTRAIADLDGVNQYVTIPTIPIVAGDTVSCRFRGNTGVGNHVLISPSVGPAAWYMTGSTWTNSLTSATATLDGVPLADGDPVPVDNREHILRITFNSSTDISFIGDYLDHNLYTADFPIYDVSIRAAAGNRFYPINDGWANNPTIADRLNPSRTIYTLDGVADYIAVPPLADSPTFTIECAIRNTDVGRNSVLLGCNFNNGFYARTSSADDKDVRILLPRAGGGFETATVTHTSSLKDGQDHFIKFERTSTTDMTVTIDGSVYNATFPNASGVSFDGVLWVGQSVSGGSGVPFNGAIYDVSITTENESRDYPIDDGWSANPVIRDTLGSGATDGSAMSFDETNWENISTRGTANNFTADTWVDIPISAGEMINGTGGMWARDCSKPDSPTFDAAYTEEYDFAYTH